MKRIFTALLCGCLLLALASCQAGPAVTQGTSSSAVASESDISDATPSAIHIQLDRVEKTLKADDGQVLVRYAYDQPTVTLSGNPTAQQAIQSDLNQLIQNDLISYAKEELLPLAQNDYQEQGSLEQPYFSDLNLTIQRTDNMVISIVTDQVSYAGGAHGGDYRSSKNYQTQTGGQLTFAMLGNSFRSTATKLVTAEAKQQADVLFDDYLDNMSHIVLDGTEDPKDIYNFDAKIAPTFYLTNQDIVFISREYELQSYAAGILEFPISYDAFGSNLNPSYLPSNYGTNADTETTTTQQGDNGGQTKPFQARNLLVPAGTLSGNGWTLVIPAEWAEKVYVKLDKDSASFYENGCHSEIDGGWLFSLMTYSDDSYEDLPDYKLLSIDGDVRYVAVYPTDVQFDGASSKNAQRYTAFSNQVEDVVRTFTLSN